jgi:dTDP-glucose 4,6-dehydratase
VERGLCDTITDFRRRLPFSEFTERDNRPAALPLSTEAASS